MRIPLAERVRPDSLADVAGQRAILGPDGLLRKIVESRQIPNMIFYGPSGTGKTTVARIIAGQTERRLYKLNATNASISDIRDIVAGLDTLLTPGGALLYLDEIQYFNKKQQQSLLEFLENGQITLIASTTENPYFYVYNAVLSRSTVFEFLPVPPEECRPAVERALRLAAAEAGLSLSCDEEALHHICQSCGGDLRKALGAVELLVNTAPLGADSLTVSAEKARAVTLHSAGRYDRDGDTHYDLMSAFQKSIRGSDPDAAVHYLARLLHAGDMSAVCRRLLVTAAEDIGLAYPQAISVTMACVQAAQQIGLPEAMIPLSEAVILCATAPKSNSAVSAIGAAMSDVAEGKGGEVPDSLRDSHYEGAAKLGHGEGYEYAHNHPGHYIRQQYLPDALSGRVYYRYGDNKNEQAAKAYWDKIKGER